MIKVHPERNKRLRWLHGTHNVSFQTTNVNLMDALEEMSGDRQQRHHLGHTYSVANFMAIHPTDLRHVNRSKKRQPAGGTEGV